MKKHLPKHYTSSVYITAVIDGDVKVLLHMHDKLKIWIGVGGHIEKDENPVEAVLREAKEETGSDIVLIPPKKSIKTKEVKEILSPQFVLQEHIPPINGMQEHIHTDMIYFGYVKDYRKVKMQEEYSWCTKEDLQNMKLQFEVSRFAPAAITVGIKYLKMYNGH